ncbi:MAG: VCBS repeat-containing protein [Blastocatellia bacterium]|nr:VCBS repeat-containing protein [Blastocatellia bacterium]
MRAIRRFTVLRISLAAVLAICCLSCGSETQPAARDANSAAKDVWFEEVALASGVDFEHIRARKVRYWFPEIMSGGGAWLDYDGDGALDLYLVQGGELDATGPSRAGNRLFRNKRDGTFQDVTESAGVGDKSYGMGCAVGDYDSDGDEDIYVTNVGPNVLYRNEGNGTFIDVSAQSRVDHSGWGTSAAFVDYDNDGRLDLFVVNYVEWSPDREIECFGGGNERDYCHPANYKAPAVDVLYHNNGNGTFTDVTVSSGISKARGNGLGVTCGDFNGDGLVDIYVANDGDPNHLWINNGDGTFTDRALITGSAVNRHGMAEAGMGVVAADIENDGDLDLFLTHLRNETNTLYLNQGELFEDATVTSGLSVPSISYTGFGTGVADFDHDGRQDIYTARGAK